MQVTDWYDANVLLIPWLEQWYTKETRTQLPGAYLNEGSTLNLLLEP